MEREKCHPGLPNEASYLCDCEASKASKKEVPLMRGVIVRKTRPENIRPPGAPIVPEPPRESFADDEAEEIFNGMSHQEKIDAQKELLSTLNPALISRLQKKQ